MACCPGSVAAYHEALSRLRHGFEFRPGRSSFTSITSSSVLRFSASTSDGFIRYRRTPLYIMSDESEYIRNSKKPFLQKHNICNIVEQASLSGYFDHYIQQFEYTTRCFDFGNEFYETERLNDANVS